MGKRGATIWNWNESTSSPGRKTGVDLPGDEVPRKRPLRWGRFSEMSRTEVAAYLEGRGFAVYDRETLESLREAAYLDERDG